MQTRSLFPALLAGLLAVGCSTAAAQDQPEPGPELREEVSEEHAERLEKARRSLIDAEEELATRRAALESARNWLELRRALVKTVRESVQADTADINSRIIAIESELGAAERRGLGDAHPSVQDLREEADKLRRRRDELAGLMEQQGDELRPALEQLREREQQVERALMRYHELAEAGPADPLRAGARRGRQMTPEERAEADRLRGLGYVAGGRAGGGARGGRARRVAPGAPFRPGAGAVPERLERLERAVDDLRRLFEEHGVPQERRERGMAEMERRRAALAGGGGVDRRRPGAGRVDHPRRGNGAGGAFGGRRGANPPPPDAEAVRARAEEMRVMLERSRAEADELRRQVEMMHTEIQRMHDVANMLQEALNARIREDAERERERGEGEGEGAR